MNKEYKKEIKNLLMYTDILIHTTFDMLKIEIGSELVFTRSDEIKCKVIDNQQVEYESEIYRLTTLSRMILQEHYNWKSRYVNGFQFWKYEDEILTDRRNRLEQEKDDDLVSNECRKR